MKQKIGKVTIETQNAGVGFATYGVARLGRKRLVGDDRPYGFDAAAATDAVRLAEKAGWLSSDEVTAAGY